MEVDDGTGCLETAATANTGAPHVSYHVFSAYADMSISLSSTCVFVSIYELVLLDILYSPSQAHRGDQAGSTHTVKVQTFPNLSEGEGQEALVYSLRWCWGQ